MNSPILSTGARLLLPVFIVFSVWILLRGHNAPGGGFVGGLIAAAGFALYAFAEGQSKARRLLRFDPQVIATIGLVAAIIAGLMPALVGGEPFAGIWTSVLGLNLANIILFDTGVYLAVVGGMLTLIFALEDAE